MQQWGIAMPAISKDRQGLLAKEHSLVPDDLERSVTQCFKLATEPTLFEQLLE